MVTSPVSRHLCRKGGQSTHLLHPHRVSPEMLPNLLVHPLLVRLAGALDQEVASVDLEEAGQQLAVVDLLAVHTVAVAPRAGVHADVHALRGRKAVEHFVDQVDEGLQQVRARPWVARVLLGCEAALGEVDADPRCARVETAPDVLFTLVDEVLDELVFGVSLNLACREYAS